MGHRPRFLVTGGINHDVILRVSHDPVHDGTAYVLSSAEALGGHAANCAVALARLGADVALKGAVGTDPAGDRALAALRDAGVSVATVIRTDRPTGQAFVVNGPEVHHMLLVRGANDDGPDVPPPRPEGPTGLTPDLLVVLDPPRTALERTLSTLAPHTQVVANPAGRITELLPVLLAAARPIVLVCNETEFARIGGPSTASRLTARLRALVVTRGPLGCRIHTAVGTADVPAVPAEAVDTTGAGDAFTAGLAAGLAAGADLRRSAALAVALGAVAVEAVGASIRLPPSAHLRALLRDRGGPGLAGLLEPPHAAGRPEERSAACA